ncbi:5,10-methylene-tetrahydrofolate dehydrogenase/Methenyl tetrahydrofolate cyclohydrolase [mine drainage metagenome]|uniref:5,10-methylene-tetrahydrofolate dehydrogenase/Methenyl tetrahydrofolate cyclohydrolase n=1 Tax=mine drainage metagenome TaxID=410659 RepID=T0Z937_9ZZZZ
MAEARQKELMSLRAGWPSEGVRPPRLVSVALGEGTPFSVYQRQQRRWAERLGIQFEAIALPEHTGGETLKARLRALDSDPSVHGILLQHPLPAPLDFFDLVSGLSPEKDVDGVGSVNLGRLVAGRPLQVPAVARAVFSVLKHYRYSIPGRRVVVLGRSETVGLPTALLFLLRGEGGDATVTVAHSRTRELSQTTREAELVVSCAGHPGLLGRQAVRPGAAVVDVGVSTRADPKAPGGMTVVGDADHADLQGYASALTPVPGGIGPVTSVELMANVLRGWALGEGLGTLP